MLELRSARGYISEPYRNELIEKGFVYLAINKDSNCPLPFKEKDRNGDNLVIFSGL